MEVRVPLFKQKKKREIKVKRVADLERACSSGGNKGAVRGSFLFFYFLLLPLRCCVLNVQVYKRCFSRGLWSWEGSMPQ